RLITPLLQRLDAAGSATRLRLDTGSNPELLSRLRQRELDLVIGRSVEPAQMAGLSTHRSRSVFTLATAATCIDASAARGG
ncbi:MAG: hypothetical protein LH479_11880, partial [Polaromonas sp.]|nr:hypothetical protein [Polaromonas sp.]